MSTAVGTAMAFRVRARVSRPAPARRARGACALQQLALGLAAVGAPATELAPVALIAGLSALGAWLLAVG